MNKIICIYGHYRVAIFAHLGARLPQSTGNLLGVNFRFYLLKKSKKKKLQNLSVMHSYLYTLRTLFLYVAKDLYIMI